MQNEAFLQTFSGKRDSLYFEHIFADFYYY